MLSIDGEMMLKDKTVIVTGVGTGLGREVACQCVRDGANVVLGARTASQLEAVAREADPSGKRVATVPTENLRRYAIEISRPRGVWCRHLVELKENPESALGLLEAVRADGSRYVQDSVANWLNDASKSRPDWVEAVTERWLRESATDQTRRIVKRALRSLRKSSPTL